MKTFDDSLNEHKRLLTESLINFNEGQRVRKIMLDIDSNSADYEYYFQAGQQSKQAEVDELRKRIDEINNHVEINYDENRDDDSHSYWSGYNQALRELFEILKGEQL